MTPQQIIGMAVRLFAIFLTLSSVGYLISIPYDLAKVGHEVNVVYSYGTGIALVVGAIALWLFPLSVANRIVPRTAFENKIHVQEREAARVGCGLIGLWLLTRVFPSLVWFLFGLFIYSGQDSAYGSLSMASKLNLLVSLAELVFSLLLIFRCSDFAALIVREGKLEASDIDPK